MSLRKWYNKVRFGLCENPVVVFGLDYYVSLLKSKTPFSFSRFGDGEWNAVFNEPGANCDGHEYLPQLGADLRNALLNKGKYYYAIQSYAIQQAGARIASFLVKNKIHWQWHYADIFHDAHNAGELYPLVEQLRRMNVVVIGPDYLRTIGNAVFDYSDFIEIPRINCYTAKDAVIEKILEIQVNSNMPTVYAFSASMASNVMIHELCPRIGEQAWLIDFGSLWDVYVGEDTRGCFKRGDWQENIRNNLGEKQQ